jgi:hypothetical protein
MVVTPLALVTVTRPSFALPVAERQFFTARDTNPPLSQFSALSVNWFTYARKNPLHGEVHRMA